MKKVLIVDDNASILEVMEIMLRDAGYTVKTESDPAMVKTSIHEFIPDLILLDLWMPGINGINIIKDLKNKKSTKKIPVIIISALNGAEENARKIGASDFIAKPFDMDLMLEMVKKHMSSS